MPILLIAYALDSFSFGAIQDRSEHRVWIVMLTLAGARLDAPTCPEKLKLAGLTASMEGAGFTVKAAEELLLVSARLVAVTVTEVGEDTVGAVNKPDELTVPAVADQVTRHICSIAHQRHQLLGCTRNDGSVRRRYGDTHGRSHGKNVIRTEGQHCVRVAGPYPEMIGGSCQQATQCGRVGCDSGYRQGSRVAVSVGGPVFDLRIRRHRGIPGNAGPAAAWADVHSADPGRRAGGGREQYPHVTVCLEAMETGDANNTDCFPEAVSAVATWVANTLPAESHRLTTWTPILAGAL